MSVTSASNAPMIFVSNARGLSDLNNWVSSISDSHPAQDYLAIAVVIQQSIEPIVRAQKAQIQMKGNVLPAEITQSKGFIRQTKDILPSRIDPAFLPFLNSEEAPLRESLVLTKSQEAVTSLSKVILLIGRIDKDQSTLEYFCEGAMQGVNSLVETMEGSFTVSAQALISDAPCLPHLADSAELRLLASPQDSKEERVASSEQSAFTLEPGKGLILERHFEQVEIEESTTELSIRLEEGTVTTKQEKDIKISRFEDVRYESESSISLESLNDLESVSSPSDEARQRNFLKV